MIQQMTYVVDTHAMIWFLEKNPRLSETARDTLRSPNAQLVIPTIVLAEINFLYTRNRIIINLSEVLDHITGAENCIVCPLDESVVEHLPAILNIRDGIIVATALTLRDELGEDVALVTKDTEIASSGLVKVIW